MSLNKALTKRQNDVLFFIKRKIEEDGLPPTIKAICTEFGFASTNNVSELLQALEKKGYIKRLTKGASRGIKIVPQDSDGIGANTLKGNKTKTLPIISGNGSDNPLLLFANFTGKITLDADMLDITGEQFAVVVADNSLLSEGISKGDIAVFKRNNAPSSASVVAVLVNDQFLIRKFTETPPGFEIAATEKGFRKIRAKIGDSSIQILGQIKTLIKKY